jgi:hypothetical protein
MWKKWQYGLQLTQSYTKNTTRYLISFSLQSCIASPQYRLLNGVGIQHIYCIQLLRRVTLSTSFIYRFDELS